MSLEGAPDYFAIARSRNYKKGTPTEFCSLEFAFTTKR
jgi:hypothetical protein